MGHTPCIRRALDTQNNLDGWLGETVEHFWAAATLFVSSSIRARAICWRSGFVKTLVLSSAFLIVFAPSDAFAFHAGYPEPIVVSIPSQTVSYRMSFNGYLFKAPHSKATIVYVYGGGCLFDSEVENLELYEFGKALIAKGYSLFIPDYRAGYKFPSLFTYPPDSLEFFNLEYANDELRDLKSAINLIARQGEKNIFVFGHSFGAYLSNLLATDTSLGPNVKGFISANGWWKPTPNLLLDLVSPVTLRPIDRPVGDLAPILVAHTIDDERIPVEQVEFFREWASAKLGPKHTIEIFPTGGHSDLITGETSNNPLLTRIYQFIDSLIIP